MGTSDLLCQELAGGLVSALFRALCSSGLMGKCSVKAVTVITIIISML